MLPFVDEPRTGVHGAHEIVHVPHGGVGRLDDVVHALVQHVEIEIGRDHGHFDELIATEDVKSRHLAINPDQARILRAVRFRIMAVDHRKPPFLLCFPRERYRL